MPWSGFTLLTPRNMVPQLNRQLAFGLLVTLMTVSINNAVGTRSTHKRFIIHVPLKMKSHHHTHTVYTHIHHGGGKVEYKVLGYSHQGLDAHGDSSDHGLPAGHAAGGGDIIFNHYARNGEHHLEDEYSSDYDDWDQ